MTSKSSNHYKTLGDMCSKEDIKEKSLEETKELSENEHSDCESSDSDEVEEFSDESESESEEELTINIIEKHNPCLNAYYDPNRIQFSYIHEDETLIAIRKGVCFRCSAYRQIMYTNLCGNYNCSQICERCISDMFNDWRN